MALTATQLAAVDTATNRAIGKGLSGSVKVLPVNVTHTASASGTSVTLGYLPSSARVVGGAVYYTDLSTNASTMDIGTTGGAGNYSTVTADPDAVGTGITIGTAAPGGQSIFTGNLADAGKQLWDIAGLSADCGGTIGITAVVKTAATTANGNLLFNVYYTID